MTRTEKQNETNAPIQSHNINTKLQTQHSSKPKKAVAVLNDFCSRMFWLLGPWEARARPWCWDERKIIHITLTYYVWMDCECAIVTAPWNSVVSNEHLVAPGKSIGDYIISIVHCSKRLELSVQSTVTGFSFLNQYKRRRKDSLWKQKWKKS